MSSNTAARSERRAPKGGTSGTVTSTRLPAAALSLLVLLGAASTESADPPRPSEYEVKAAFLYNFAKFVAWPEEGRPGPIFVIAVLGQDSFGDLLQRTLDGKTILERKVEVRRISTPAAANDVQIVFIGSSEKARLPEILHALQGASVLTVGDMDGFADRGGMIAFRLQDDLVRFDINLDQVNRARLKMSSQLVRLAQHVISRNDGN
jgi:hypothetical protein